MSEITLASTATAFAANHELKALPFDPTKLDGFSEKLIRSHWENNYGGSVKALNTVKQILASFLDDANLPAFIYNDLKREHLMNTGSVVLRELYFGNLGGSGKAEAALQKFWQMPSVVLIYGRKNFAGWVPDSAAVPAG